MAFNIAAALGGYQGQGGLVPALLANQQRQKQAQQEQQEKQALAQAYQLRQMQGSPTQAPAPPQGAPATPPMSPQQNGGQPPVPPPSQGAPPSQPMGGIPTPKPPMGGLPPQQNAAPKLPVAGLPQQQDTAKKSPDSQIPGLIPLPDYNTVMTKIASMPGEDWQKEKALDLYWQQALPIIKQNQEIKKAYQEQQHQGFEEFAKQKELGFDQQRIGIDQQKVRLEAKRVGIEDRKEQFSEKALSGDSPESIKLRVDLAATGDPTAFQNISRGKSGDAIRNQIWTGLAKTPGMTAEKLAGLHLQFRSLTSEESALGTQTAKITTAGHEFDGIAKLALASSEKVDRSKYPTLNSIIEAADKKTGDTNVVALATNARGAVNTWARAINPNGVATVEATQAGIELLNVAYSKGQFAEAIKQMGNEAEAARQGPEQTQQDINTKINPKGGGATGGADYSHLWSGD